MNKRRLPLGNQNMIGARVAQMRKERGFTQVDVIAKLQISEIDISIPALSLLEGQKRPVTDFELCALADILCVDVDWLLGRSK